METYLFNAEDTCISLEAKSILGKRTFSPSKTPFQIYIMKEIFSHLQDK